MARAWRQSRREVLRGLVAAGGTGLTTGLGLAGCSASPAETGRIRIAHTLNTEHPVHKGLIVFADRLAEISSGGMSVDIYPSAQLGTERQLIELCQIGSIAMTKVSTLSMEGFSPPMQLFSIPYLFADEAHLWRVLESDIGRELLDGLMDVRLKGMAYYDAGSRSFYATEAPIRSPADLKGKKIRVLPSRVAIDMVAALGGSATPISFGELYTALQQGIVDGAENNPPSYYLSKHFEIAPYYTLDEHTAVPDVIIMSKHVWDQLSGEQRSWVQQALDESVVAQRRFWAEDQAAAIEAVEAAGSEVIRPDKAPFREAVAGMKASFLKSPELGPLIRRVDAMAAAS